MAPEPTAELDSELESFRRKWISDIKSHHDDPQEQHHGPSSFGPHAPLSPPPSASIFGPFKHSSAPASKSAAQPISEHHDEDLLHETRIFGDRESDDEALHSKDYEMRDDDPGMTALEAYERAAAREANGQLGESLMLYHKAFKLNDRVDQEYRGKHHGNASLPHVTNLAVPTTLADPTAPASSTTLANPAASAPTPALFDLATSFSHLSIIPAPPPVEGDPAPPCPMAALPTEILLHILGDVAVTDVGDFARLARVCRHFAFIVATEERIWRRVCEQSVFSFAAMHRRWKFSLDDPTPSPEEMDEIISRQITIQPPNTHYLLASDYSSSWHKMFRSRPRIRFNGCYITTVNYQRSGMALTAQVSWANPIHIVTYYRYLRFFRDGSVISLLTTTPPDKVVNHLTRKALEDHGGGRYGKDWATGGATVHVAQGALRGRWRLGGHDGEEGDGGGDGQECGDGDDGNGYDANETSLVVETDGISPKYIYRMELDMRSAGRRTRNNKLAWKGFYSYNKLTDDWAEFGLKHDKPFIFSRVKSYGLGE